MARSFAHFGILLLILCHATSAVADAVDPERMKAAEARAQRRWSDAGYDRMPSFDSARLAAIAGDAARADVVDVIAQVLSSENPAKTGAVMRYLNDTLIPFISANKKRYICIKAEDYYNLAVSTQDITKVQEYGETWIFDLAFWLLQTKAARRGAQLALPDSYNAVLDPIGSYVEENGWTMRGNTVRLDCANVVSLRSRSPEEEIGG